MLPKSDSENAVRISVMLLLLMLGCEVDDFEKYKICRVNFTRIVFLVFFLVVQWIVIVEEVAHAAREPWHWCPDHKHSVGIWSQCRIGTCYATTRTRLCSWQSAPHPSTAETLGVHSATSTRFDWLQWLCCVGLYVPMGAVLHYCSAAVKVGFKRWQSSYYLTSETR